MRIALFAALLASTALADVTVNGTVRVVADGGFHLTDDYGDTLTFTDERMDVGRDLPLFTDRFTGTAVAAHNKWVQSLATMTATVGAGAITLNAGAVTTINTYATLATASKFRGYVDAALVAQVRARPVNLPQTNTVAELGLGNATANTAPTDGAFFRWTSSGGFECVINRGGAETSVAMAAPTANVYSIFSIRTKGDRQICRYVTPSTGADVRAVIALDAAAPSAFNESPGGLIRLYNGAVAPALAPQLIVGLFELSKKVLDEARPPEVTAAIAGQSSVATPTTGAQAANNANSAAPASVVPTNIAAGYTTLGGRWQFAAVAGAATDLILFGYQVPVSYRFVMTGISISTCNTVVAVATTPTAFEWSLGLNSTAVSLATTDGTGATPTSAPRRISIGKQSLPVGATPEQCAPDLVRVFNSPRTVESGRFLQVILQMPVGTATATEIFRGTVTVDGYFEQ
jgi:hypothetical protein